MSLSRRNFVTSFFIKTFFPYCLLYIEILDGLVDNDNYNGDFKYVDNNYFLIKLLLYQFFPAARCWKWDARRARIQTREMVIWLGFILVFPFFPSVMSFLFPKSFFVTSKHYFPFPVIDLKFHPFWSHMYFVKYNFQFHTDFWITAHCSFRREIVTLIKNSSLILSFHVTLSTRAARPFECIFVCMH